jgi:hypothetical protein
VGAQKESPAKMPGFPLHVPFPRTPSRECHSEKNGEAWQECGDAGEAFDFIRGVAKKTHKD